MQWLTVSLVPLLGCHSPSDSHAALVQSEWRRPKDPSGRLPWCFLASAWRKTSAEEFLESFSSRVCLFERLRIVNGRENVANPRNV